VPLDSLFRLSTYLTLALATLCLVSTEEPFFEGITYSAIPLGLLLAAAYKLDRRWTLSAAGSNIAGLLIAAVSAGWIGYRILRDPPTWTDTVPYPAALLPFGGPVLMLLLVAKLFRPKQIADFWSLHLIGLLQVALACVLAGDPVFGLLLFGYLTAASWSLMLFHQYREAQAVSAPASRSREPSGTLPLVPLASGHLQARLGVIAGLALSTRRAVVLALLGTSLFLLTPRWSRTQWTFPSAAAGSARRQGEVGFSRRIDLHLFGTLKISDKIAFEVIAEDARGAPKTDLSLDQRWRGMTLDNYENGTWAGRLLDLPNPNQPALYRLREGVGANLPQLGPDQYYLTFTLDPRDVGGLFVADPVVMPRGNQPSRAARRLPFIAVTSSQWRPTLHLRDGTLTAQINVAPHEYRYVQVTRPLQANEPVRALRLTPEYESRLLAQPVAGIRSWTKQLLERLVSEGKLTRTEWSTEAATHVDQRHPLPPARRAPVARALTDYLAQSGEYTYSLELRRKDPYLDPTEDFLCNVKQGHCEYYATALALMLRSAGIPARLVNGFRGLESKYEHGQPTGKYIVRESHAHAWVEALVGNADEPGQRLWITLDPTSVVQAAASGSSLSLSRWWDTTTSVGRAVWRGLFIESERNPLHDTVVSFVEAEFTPESFNSVLDWAKWKLVPRWSWLVYASGALLLIPAVWLVRRFRRRSLNRRDKPGPALDSQPEVSFYARWLAIVARKYRLMPLPSQTPLEFAGVVRHAFRRAVSTAGLAPLPDAVVRLYYRARYGGRPLTAPEQENMDRQLSQVESALSKEGV
jgi:transglutaminase-like putative cysteine protease